jgi:hypothetical protein
VYSGDAAKSCVGSRLLRSASCPIGYELANEGGDQRVILFDGSASNALAHAAEEHLIQQPNHTVRP